MKSPIVIYDLRLLNNGVPLEAFNTPEEAIHARHNKYKDLITSICIK